MPEAGGSNIEIANHLSEHDKSAQSLGHAILEIVEALVLATVAIATAWSGYQAALWTGHDAYRIQHSVLPVAAKCAERTVSDGPHGGFKAMQAYSVK